MVFEKLWELSSRRKSRLIVAIDEARAFKDVSSTLSQLEESAAGVKFGFPALLGLGPEGMRSAMKEWRDKFYFLADFKVADIPHICGVILEQSKEMGFDGATVHVFQRGIEVLDLTKVPELVAVLSMSHVSPALDEEYEANLSYAKEVGIEGAVVGASKWSFIERAKKNGLVVFSPGVGAQGSEVGSALTKGADFEIVGRHITLSKDVRSAANEAARAHRRALNLDLSL